MSGKKIRIKKTKSSISHSGHGSQSNTLHRSPTEADCLRASHSFVTEEARISIGLAASRQSATRIGPLWPSIATSGFSSEDAGAFAVVRTAPLTGGTPLPDLGFQSIRESPYVTLPASASPRTGVDPTTTASTLASRSPKPPAPRLRFRCVFYPIRADDLRDKARRLKVGCSMPSEALGGNTQPSAMDTSIKGNEAPCLICWYVVGLVLQSRVI
jgi:hypothetical protein